jgi:protein-disulfide isomerase/uncharacterized membrane protein
MKKLVGLILFFSFAGLVASATMSKMHFDLMRGGFESKSFCNISEFVDCDTALASPYSKISGIPNSHLGVAYYLFFFFATLFAALSESNRKRTLSFLLAGSTGSILYSIVMAYLSFYKIGVLCLLCLTTYIANIAHLLCLPPLLGIRLGGVPHYLFQYALSLFGRGLLMPTKVWVHLILFGLTIGCTLVFFRGIDPEAASAPPKASDELYLKLFYSQTPVDLQTGPQAGWGPPEAPVTLIEFSDFQCPFCRRAAFSIKPFLGPLEKKVRILFFNYPLDNSCNPEIDRRFHPVACLTAKAALCAGKGGKFWGMHDLIFENQKKISRANLIRWAGELGLEEQWMDECLVSEEIATRLAQEIAEGKRFGVKGTPAVYINGRPLRDWTDPERLRLVVEAEISGGRPPGRPPESH